MKMEEIVSPEKQTVGIMFGRFNPSHVGHKAAWQMASENDSWYIGTNQSTQGPKDPLPFDAKLAAIQALWEPAAAHVKPEKNLFTLCAWVYSKHGETNLKVYTDEQWLTSSLKKYNGKQGGHGLYKFKAIEQVPTPRLSSATQVRDAVAQGDKKAFSKAAGVPWNTQVMGENYFDLVARYLSEQ